MNTLVTKILKVKGQTPFAQAYTPGTQLTFVGSMAQAWRGFWLNFTGRVAFSAATGTNITIDNILQALGTMEVTLVNDSQDIPIIPAGSPVREIFHNLRRLYESTKYDTDRNGHMFTPIQLSSGLPVGASHIYYRGVGGAAGQTYDFGVQIYVPFSGIGFNDSEKDIALLNPRSGDRQLNIIITPPVWGAGNADLSATAPFPASTCTATLSGVGGVGTAQVVLIGDYTAPILAGSKNGIWLPRWQNKNITFTNGSTLLSEQQLTNWDRGGFWHALFFNEYDYIPSTGTQYWRGDVVKTCLQDFTLLADSDHLLEDNLLGRAAKQNPVQISADVTTAVWGDYMNPNVINLNNGKSAFSLPNYSQYIQANKQINMQFDNVKTAQIANTSGLVRNVSAWTLRYVPRS